MSTTYDEISENVTAVLESISHKKIMQFAYIKYDKYTPTQISPCMYKSARRCYKIEMLTKMIAGLMQNKGIEIIRPPPIPNCIVSNEQDYLR